MRMKRSDESKKGRSVLLGLILLLLAVGLFLMEDEEKAIEQVKNLNSKEAQQLVNRHLRQTSQNMVLNQQKSAIETQKEMINAQKSKPQQKFDDRSQELEISQYQDNPMFNQSVGRGAKSYDPAQDPSQIVQGKLFQDQVEEKYSEQYKKEYTRQFIENAKSAGWEIKVDASYRVISTKKIQRAPTYEVFEGENGGSR